MFGAPYNAKPIIAMTRSCAYSSMGGRFTMDSIAGAAFGMQVDSLANPEEPFNVQGLRLLDQSWLVPFLRKFPFY